MSLTITQRPYQTIDGVRSVWNAAAHPLIYKMQRKDFTFASITNSGGFVRLVLSSSHGDVSASFAVNDVVYFTTDAGVYDTTGTVTASSYSAPNTLVTLSTAYISSSTGFVNNDDLRSLYGVDVDVYDLDGVLMNDDSFRFTPTSKGLITADISSIVKAQMIANNDADLTGTTKVFDDTNIYQGFYIKYTEVWLGSANSATSDYQYEHYAIYGAMQIPSANGSNIYDYLILSIMKVTRTNILTASVLTGNTTAVAVTETPDASSVIVPVMFLVYLDYAGVAYATNTTFRFEINGVAVTGTNTSILPGTADRYTTILPVAYDTTTSMLGQAVKFKVQTGDPTAGTSPLRIDAIYTIRDVIS
jgi:hypothetical protein